MGRISIRDALEYSINETIKLLGDFFKECLIDDECFKVVEDMHDTVVSLIVNGKYEVRI